MWLVWGPKGVELGEPTCDFENRFKMKDLLLFLLFPDKVFYLIVDIMMVTRGEPQLIFAWHAYLRWFVWAM